MNIKFAASTIKGKYRSNNQDNYYLDGIIKSIDQENDCHTDTINNDNAVFMVCDGMGGESHGEMAAWMTVSFLKDISEHPSISELESIVRSVNKDIVKYQKQNSVRMGTTMVCVLVKGREILSLNIGDSRAYIIQNDNIFQISKDHTEFQILVDAGIFKEEDFNSSKLHNHLTQHLGIDTSDMELEPYIERNIVDYGSRILLCSDGLYGKLDKKTILESIIDENDLNNCVKNLLSKAEESGSRDNITAILIEINE